MPNKKPARLPGQAALTYFTRASEGGYAPAHYELGHSFKNGTLGQTKDLEKALDLYKRAGEGGWTNGWDGLTAHYLNAKQHDQARITNDQALKNPSNNSFLHRAMGEEYGWMCYAKNATAALSWYQKAADDGSAEATYRIGKAYTLRGFGLVDDVKGRDTGARPAEQAIGFMPAVPGAARHGPVSSRASRWRSIALAARQSRRSPGHQKT